MPGEIRGSASTNSTIYWVHNKNAGPFVQKAGEKLLFSSVVFATCPVLNLLFMSHSLRHGDICWVGKTPPTGAPGPPATWCLGYMHSPGTHTQVPAMVGGWQLSLGMDLGSGC